MKLIHWNLWEILCLFYGNNNDIKYCWKTSQLFSPITYVKYEYILKLFYTNCLKISPWNLYSSCLYFFHLLVGCLGDIPFFLGLCFYHSPWENTFINYLKNVEEGFWIYWFLETILHQIPNILRRKHIHHCNSPIIIIVSIKLRYLRISQVCAWCFNLWLYKKLSPCW